MYVHVSTFILASLLQSAVATSNRPGDLVGDSIPHSTLHNGGARQAQSEQVQIPRVDIPFCVTTCRTTWGRVLKRDPDPTFITSCQQALCDYDQHRGSLNQGAELREEALARATYECLQLRGHSPKACRVLEPCLRTELSDEKFRAAEPDLVLDRANKRCAKEFAVAQCVIERAIHDCVEGRLIDHLRSRAPSNVLSLGLNFQNWDHSLKEYCKTQPTWLVLSTALWFLLQNGGGRIEKPLLDHDE